MLSPGDVFAERFEIAGVLGRGGTATVYLARDRERGEEIALKVVHAHLAGAASTRERLRREIAAAGRVRHPAALVAWDLHRDGDAVALALPLHRGAPLADHVATGGPWPEPRLRDLLTDIGGALAAAHRVGALHRDVSPQNLLIDDAGRATLTDFGLARMADARTVTTQALGTPGYAAPEIYDGRPADPRGDLYGLGAAAWFAAAGRGPFEASTPMATLQRQLAGEHDDLAALRPDLSPALVAVIEALIRPDPDHRPPSAQAIGDALDGALALAAPAVPSAEGDPLTAGAARSTLAVLAVSAATSPLAFALSGAIDGQLIPEPGVLAMAHGIAMFIGLPLSLLPALRGGLRADGPPQTPARAWAGLGAAAVFLVAWGLFAGLVGPNLGGTEPQRVMGLVLGHAALWSAVASAVLASTGALAAAHLGRRAATPAALEGDLIDRARAQLDGLETAVGALPGPARSDAAALVRSLRAWVDGCERDARETAAALVDAAPARTAGELDRVEREIERRRTLGQADPDALADLERARAGLARSLAESEALQTRATRATAGVLEVIAVAGSARRRLETPAERADPSAMLAKLEAALDAADAAAKELEAERP